MRSERRRPFVSILDSCRRWSLWDMLKLYADKFAALNAWLRQMQLVYLNPASIDSVGPAPSPLSNERLHALKFEVERAKTLAGEINLIGTGNVCDRLLVAVGDPEDAKRHMIGNYADDISHLLGEISVRLREELGQRIFLQLSTEGASKYEKAQKIFDGNVWNKFTEARYDLEEATNCLALERSTAAIFHSMKVMERSLHAVHLCLGLAWPLVGNDKNWGNILRGIRDELTKRGSSSRWPERNFFDQLYALLDSVKGGWRNPALHVDEKFTQPEAERIYRAVSDFISRIADRMDERGQPLA